MDFVVAKLLDMVVLENCRFVVVILLVGNRYHLLNSLVVPLLCDCRVVSGTEIDFCRLKKIVDKRKESAYNILE